jgi:putative cardiolipin synthase
MIGLFTPTRTLALLVPLLFTSCTVITRIPRSENKPMTRALDAPASGRLVASASQVARGRAAGDSSFLLIGKNREALEWRLALIDEARSSVDIQLYLWHGGASGSLLLDRVMRAADRGVRVRILVDDFLFASDENQIAALSHYHPNLEIRIFNPSRLRGNSLGFATEFVLNFRQLNRRMHNKTWTVDRAFSIVGGRNVADHYFGLDEHYNFLDLDVLAAGPVVADISESFDSFWNAEQSCPASLLSKRAKSEDLDALRATVAENLNREGEGRLLSFPTERRDWSREFACLPGRMVTGRARFLSDDPNPEHDHRQVLSGLKDMTRRQHGEVLYVTPYLIPSRGAIAQVKEDVASGIRVGILAPSLVANNQPLAHGHYRRKRPAIVGTGVELYELRGDAGTRLRSLVDTDPIRCRDIALHMKAVLGDRERCFIGSLNLDPRSLQINPRADC